MADENPADRFTQPGFAEPQQAELKEKTVEPELLPPSKIVDRPKPLPKFRQSPGTSANGSGNNPKSQEAKSTPQTPAEKNAGRDAPQSDDKASRRRRLILFTLAVVVCAFVGMLANLAVPILSDLFFPPKWVADYRHAKSLANSDWDQANAGMLTALADGKQANAPLKQQLATKIDYGRVLMGQEKYADAGKTFGSVAAEAHEASLQDSEVLPLILAGECQHQQFVQGALSVPDLSEEEKGLQLAKQWKQTEREAYAYLILGQLNSDIGKSDIAEKDFNQAESIWSNNPGRLQEVARARWRELTRASLATLAKMPPAAKHAPVGRNGQAWAPGNVLNLLENKKFAELDKVVADAQSHRGRLADGQEEANSLFGVLADLPENSTDADWQRRLTLLQSWIAAEPTAATPHVVLASYYNNFAWKARGGDWGNKVSNQQWSDFHKRLSLGAAQLNQALKFAPLTPEWFDVAQTNFLGGGDNADIPLYNKLAAEGIRNFPDYLPIYLNKAYYLQPRWHGKGEQWVTFITQEADKIGGLEGDKFYARMVNYVKSLYEDVYKEFPKLSRSRAERGSKALQKAYPGSNFGKDK